MPAAEPRPVTRWSGPVVPDVMFASWHVRLSPLPLGLDVGRPAARSARIAWIAPLYASQSAGAVRQRKQSTEAAQVERAERVAEPDSRAWGREDARNRRGGDYGPGHQHRARFGPNVHTPFARVARLEVVTGEDPQRPMHLVRHAKVRDPLRAMSDRGVIGKRELAAAARFREDGEIAAVGFGNSSLASAGGGGGGTPPHARSSPAPEQADARERLLRAWRAIGDDQMLFAWVVINLGTLDAYARTYQVRRESVSEQLRGTLGRLAEHYGIPHEGTETKAR